MAVSGDGAWATTVDAQGWITVIDLGSGDADSTLDLLADWRGSVAMSPDDRVVAVAGRNSDVIFLRPESSSIERVSVGGAPIRSLVFSKDGNTVFAGAEDGTIRTLPVD